MCVEGGVGHFIDGSKFDNNDFIKTDSLIISTKQIWQFSNFLKLAQFLG